MISERFDQRPLGTYDLTVIGSGPAGLVLALEAAKAGLKVLVLESGGVTPDPRQQALSDAEIADPARHDPMAIAVARRLGGTSNLWAARCQPFDPIDFEDRPGLHGALWPVSHAEIRPWYAKALAYLAAGEDVFQAPVPGLGPVDDAFDPTRLERFSNVPAIQKHFARELQESERIDIRLNSTVVDLHLEEGAIRRLTVVDGEDRRHEVPVSRVALACGGLETTRQLLALQSKHPTLFGGPEGPLGRFYMGHIIGEVADIVFTSETADAAYDFFLDGHGSYARRRIVPSDALQRAKGLPNVCFWPVVPPVADARHRSGILSMVCLAFAIGPLGRLLVPEAIRKRHIPEQLDWLAHVRNVLADLPRTALYLPRFFWQRYFAAMRLPGFFLRNAGRRYGLSYHAEQSPDPDSRVRLAGTADRTGLPRLAIDYRFTRSDAEALMRAHRALGDWLVRNGIGRLEYRQPEEETVDAILAIAAHGTHQIGTARMAERPEDGVVDRDLRCFGIDNLFVASSATFPTSGLCNPTLSIAAFSARLAEHLAAPARPVP